MKHKSLAIVMCAVLLNGCTAVAERNPYDPYEPYNRAMFKFNDKADQYVLKPVAKGYRKVTPQPVRTVVSNFFNNLRDVVSLGSNVLRGEMGKAGYDFMRVATNTTLGVGGLFNIADEAGMPNNKNTLGDTFATWGWKKSNYFVYPLLGPSTVRDSLADTIIGVYPIESAVVPKTAGRYAVATLKAVDKREGLLEMTERLDQMAMDKYAYTRDMYMAMRNKQLGNEVPEENDLNVDDLVTADEHKTETPLNPTPAQPIDLNKANSVNINTSHTPIRQTDSDLAEQEAAQYRSLASQIWQYKPH